MPSGRFGSTALCELGNRLVPEVMEAEGNKVNRCPPPINLSLSDAVARL